jgi:hypothetical protein
VFQQVDSFLQKLSTEVEHKPPTGQPTNIVIVTDGQLPLRQCLLPETCSKGINDPPAVFGIFYDLRKEFRKGFPNAPEINSIQDMINCKSHFDFLLFQSVDSTQNVGGCSLWEKQNVRKIIICTTSPSSRSNLI